MQENLGEGARNTSVNMVMSSAFCCRCVVVLFVVVVDGRALDLSGGSYCGEIIES